MVSLVEKAKSFGKRVIGQPEQPVPVVSIKDWASSVTSSPSRGVRASPTISEEAQLTDHVPGAAIRRKFIPHRRMDHAIQYAHCFTMFHRKLQTDAACRPRVAIR